MPNRAWLLEMNVVWCKETSRPRCSGDLVGIAVYFTFSWFSYSNWRWWFQSASIFSCPRSRLAR